MTTVKAVLLTMGVLGLVACAQHKKDRTRTGQKDLGNAGAPGPQQNPQGANVELGPIELNGMIVRHDAVRIQGLSESNRKSIKASDSVKDEDKRTLDKTLADRTYISLGCTDLSQSETENLKKIEVNNREDTGTAYQASKIFICRGGATKSSIISFIADEIVMKAATLTVKAGTSVSLLISANKLTLKGQSSLVAEAKANETPPRIILTVVKAIDPQENGMLLIRSKSDKAIVQTPVKNTQKTVSIGDTAL